MTFHGNPSLFGGVPIWFQVLLACMLSGLVDGSVTVMKEPVAALEPMKIDILDSSPMVVEEPGTTTNLASWMGLDTLWSEVFGTPAKAGAPVWPLTRGEVFFAGKPRRGLYIDTGAAANLSGDKSLLEHEERVLKPLNHPNLKIQKAETTATFSRGIPSSWQISGIVFCICARIE